MIMGTIITLVVIPITILAIVVADQPIPEIKVRDTQHHSYSHK
jgi:hypothetical protein